MECFYHESQSAVGICKSCQRGLCRTCAVEVKNGIACSGACEAEAEKLDRLVQQSESMSTEAVKLTNSVSMLSVELFNFVLGLIFAGMGLYLNNRLLLILGSAFLLFGTYGLIRVWKASKESSKGA